MSKKPKTDGTIREVPLDDLVMSPHNKRGTVKPADVASMVAQLESGGRINQPPLGRAVPDSQAIELAYGTRRLAACKAAGLRTMPVLVRRMGDDEFILATVTENLDQANMTPIQEALSIQAMLDRRDATFESVGVELGRTAAFVARRAQLARLSPAWQKALAQPESEENRLPGLSVAHLELVARLPEKQQDSLLAPDCYHFCGGIPTVAKLRAILAGDMTLLSSFSWRLDDEVLVPEAGSCTACPTKAGAQRELWDTAELTVSKRGKGGKVKTEESAKCTDTACREAKLEAFIQQQLVKTRSDHKSVLLLSQRSMESDRHKECKRLFGGSAEWDYRFTSVKKSAPNAKPAIYINGPRAGKLVWVWKQGSASGGSPAGGSNGKGASRKTGADAPPPTTLKHRRRKLQERRWAYAVTAFAKALHKLQPSDLEGIYEAIHDRKDKPVGLVQLLLAFGTNTNHSQLWGGHDKAWDQYGRFQKMAGEQKGQVTLGGMVLKSVIAVWIKRLDFRDNKHISVKADNANWMCGVLDFDWHGYMVAAKKAIPEPKSWANLKADGTVKTISSKPKPGKSPAAVVKKSTTPVKKSTTPVKKKAGKKKAGRAPK